MGWRYSHGMTRFSVMACHPHQRLSFNISKKIDQTEYYGIVSAQFLNIPLPHRRNVWSRSDACVIP